MTSSPAFALALGFVAACGGSVAAPSVAGVDATTVYWTNQYAGTVVRMTPSEARARGSVSSAPRS